MENIVNSKESLQDSKQEVETVTKGELLKILISPLDNPNGWSSLRVSGDVKKGLYEVINAECAPYFRVYDTIWKCVGGDFQRERGSTNGIENEVEGKAELRWEPGVKFDEKWVKDKNGTYQKKEVVQVGSKGAYTREFGGFELVDMDGIIELDNGKLLINRYGKYQPNLSFINDAPEVRFQRISNRDLNFDEGDFSVLYGEFFVSKKGTKCFRVLPKERAKHVLIRDDWGGAFNKYRGRTLPEDGAVYYRRASSNGGGSGYDYGVYEKDFKNTLSEDDI